VSVHRFIRSFALVGLIVSPFTAFAAGDAAKGEEIYAECAGCHSMKENVVGPRHCGVVGRKAGSVADFPSYSHAMKDSGLTWDEKTLNEFLADPLTYVPETAMGFIGLHDEQQRLDVIAFLKKQNDDPAVCPK